MWPYCQTIFRLRIDDDDRWCQSSVTAIIPFGQRTASDGRSSDPARRGPYVQTICPRRRELVDAARRVEPATRMLPSGSSCASDGYVVGVRTRVDEAAPAVEPVDPAADLGDEDAAVGKRVAPFGEQRRVGRVVAAARRRGRSERTTRCACRRQEHAAVWMSATINRPLRSR